MSILGKEKVQEVEYNPGDYILREGANCDHLIIVKSGQIEVFKIGIGGTHIPLGLVQSGEYLGEMAMISDRPHSANAVALTKTLCIRIPTSVIEEQLKELPSWLVALTRGLVYKLNKTNDVLRRNGIVDDTLTTAVRAITEREELNKKDKPS
ncbi:MAG: cyclic nucleotide-binding domain-containing protein [Bdellovibrionaceae bacterium]|nr:cyclic nucleotide-binding domain-containing protein [Pseudobdellovibrionaceae bacterium]